MSRKESKGRVRKVFGLAALGALGAWLINKKRKAATPEGTWRDLNTPTERNPTSD